MSVKEIEKAIKELSADEIVELTEWFDEFRADAWDKQIAADSDSGKLDRLIGQAHRCFEAGNITPL